MAEARSAVSYRVLQPKLSFVVSDEEIVLRISTNAIPSFFTSIRSSVERRLFRLRNAIVNAFYPVPPYQWTLYFAAPAAIMLSDRPQLQHVKDLLFKLDSYIPHYPWLPQVGRVGLVALGVGSSIILVSSYVRKIMLSLLLSYQGWLYDNPKQTNWVTVVWGAAVKFVSGQMTTLIKQTPLLYSNQHSLPSLPVPPLEQTCTRYLASVEPILPPQEFQEMKNLVAEFKRKEGPIFQRYLVLKSFIAPNYVTDWWETFVYLRGRSPIVINSNYYVLDSKAPLLTDKPVARAAFIIFEFLNFKEMIDSEKLQPMVIRNTVPMCMRQYEKMYSTTRIPGKEIDTLRQYDFNQSRHVAILRKGQWYVLDAFHTDGSRLSAVELESQLKWIVADADRNPPDVNDPVYNLAALTTENRTTWANARSECFSTGTNRTSLFMIESSLFVLSLDHEMPTEDTFEGRGHSLFHGNGSNRWCDKSFNVVLFPNARMGLHVEHSWADAPVISHMMEYSLIVGEEKGELKYGPDGYIKRDPSKPPRPHAPPIKLHWKLTDLAHQYIRQAVVNVNKLIADIDLHIMHFNNYGKGFIKLAKISPDAYVQIALQVAYMKEANTFALTYESSMTRLFRNGRTETVRPVSMESRKFVETFFDPSVPKSEKIKLLQKAGEVHQNAYRDAMTGKGIDRHMFAMYVVSQGLGIKSDFLNKALSMEWRVSTSQQPQNQTGLWDPAKDADKISPGGGFGPVADAGYGVSYMIANDKEFFFHISSKVSSPATDSRRFGKHIHDALMEMKELFS